MIHLALWILAAGVVLAAIIAIFVGGLVVLSTETGRTIVGSILIIAVAFIYLEYHYQQTDGYKYQQCIKAGQDVWNAEADSNLPLTDYLTQCNQEYPTK